MVNDVTNFLEKLLDEDKLFLSDFQKVHDITQRLKNSFTEEINLV